jgi:hypothetical protein
MNIRKRLVAWHTGILAGLLLIFTFGVYLALKFHLNTEVNDSLESWAANSVESVASNTAAGFRTASNHMGLGFNTPDSFKVVLDPKAPIISDYAELSKSGLLTLQHYLKGHVAPALGAYGTINLNGRLFRIFIKEIIPASGNRGTI